MLDRVKWTAELKSR